MKLKKKSYELCIDAWQFQYIFTLFIVWKICFYTYRENLVKFHYIFTFYFKNSYSSFLPFTLNIFV